MADRGGPEMSRFFGQISNLQVKSAVADFFHQDQSSEDIIPSDLYISWASIYYRSPRVFWAIREVTRLHNPNLWHKILGLALVESPVSQARVRAFTNTYNETEAISLIVDRNIGFLNLAIDTIALSSLLGRDHLQYIRSDLPYQAHILAAGEAISHKFTHPITTAQETILRYRKLFSQQDTGTSALEYLKNAHAFASVTTETGCPAISLTQALFDAYGDLLQDPSYIASLTHRIEFPRYADFDPPCLT